ncbi:protein kinase family protein [Flavisolibacter sp. BT320]|nr:protein kinase family protein [Flavisolibacter longurius]
MIRFYQDNIKLDRDPEENYLQIDNIDFRLDYLSSSESNKGASSNLFVLVDPEGEYDDRVIKICKTPLEYGNNKRHTRFRREIKAFRLAKNKNLTNVVEFFSSGEVEIDGLTFLFIIMEKAEEDLASYLERNKFSFSVNQKLAFCVNILNGIKQLHSLKIYHRDIKHDNILRINHQFKVGDLGLVRFQNEDFSIDKDNEKVGPFGWLSPEATNKMLTYKKNIGFKYDCDINYKSDIFQLGKLFWYIFQGNIPVGQTAREDYRFENDIYQILSLMLQYDKQRRPSLNELEVMLEPLMIKYAV